MISEEVSPGNPGEENLARTSRLFAIRLRMFGKRLVRQSRQAFSR